MASTAKLSSILWTEKYRPTEIKHLIIPDRIRTRFQDGIDSNILLSGTAGTGKTTLAKILAKDRSCLMINASDENGIDIIRNKVKDFARTSSLISTNKKVIILDESCNLSKDAQQALKATIEAFSNNVLFVFTANHPEKLIAPLHSRLEPISFNFSEEEEKQQMQQYVNRIKNILKAEGNYTIQKEALIYLIKNVYPDMRAIINKLYQATRTIEVGSEITMDSMTKATVGENGDFYDFIVKEHQPHKIYSYVKGKFSGKENNALQSLGVPFLEYLNTNDMSPKVLQASVISHKYIYEASTGAIDPLIPLLACCSALSEIFKS